MKKLIATLILFSITFICIAQQSQNMKIVERIAKPYIENNCFTVKFSADVSSNKVHGTIYVSGNKYRVDTDDFQLIFDGKDRYNYIKKNNEVYIESQQENDDNIMQSPQRLLELTKYAEPTIKSNTDGTKYITFEKEGLELCVDKNDKILNIKVVGNKTTINIISSDTQTKLQESMFTFNREQYKDIDIIDFR